jgi:hypothetical protein
MPGRMASLLALALCQTLIATPHDAPVMVTARVSEARFLPGDIELPSPGLLLGRTALVAPFMAVGAVGAGLIGIGAGSLLTLFFGPGPDLLLLGTIVMAGLGAIAGLIMACTFGSLSARADLGVIIPIVLSATLLVGAAVVFAAMLGAPLAPLLGIAGAVTLSMPLVTAWAKANQAREEFGLNIARF